MKLRHRACGAIGGALATALGALAACGQAGNDGNLASPDAGIDSDAGGSASSSGGTSSGSTDSSGNPGSDGATSDDGSDGQSFLPPVYQVTPVPEWDAVFNNTGHTGDGFDWIPLGIRNRQGLGTSATNSVVLFADSNYAGHFFHSTAGQYTGGITPDPARDAASHPLIVTT
jgi:hypothetical protein